MRLQLRSQLILWAALKLGWPFRNVPDWGGICTLLSLHQPVITGRQSMGGSVFLWQRAVPFEGHICEPWAAVIFLEAEGMGTSTLKRGPGWSIISPTTPSMLAIHWLVSLSAPDQNTHLSPRLYFRLSVPPLKTTFVILVASWVNLGLEYWQTGHVLGSCLWFLGFPIQHVTQGHLQGNISEAFLLGPHPLFFLKFFNYSWH